MRRLLWLVASYVAGLGTAFWLRRRVRRAVENCMPGRIRHVAAERSRAAVGRARCAARDRARSVVLGARRVTHDVRDAMAEGRAAMRRTESEFMS